MKRRFTLALLTMVVAAPLVYALAQSQPQVDISQRTIVHSRAGIPPVPGLEVTLVTDRAAYFQMQPIHCRLKVKASKSVGPGDMPHFQDPTEIIVKDRWGTVLPLTAGGQSLKKHQEEPVDFTDSTLRRMNINATDTWTYDFWLNKYVDLTAVGIGHSRDDREPVTVQVKYFGHLTEPEQFDIVGTDFDLDDPEFVKAIQKGEFDGEKLKRDEFYANDTPQ